MANLPMEKLGQSLTDHERRKRLVYRASHRGMRELDVTFGAWVSHLDASGRLSEARVAQLELLLERSEPDLLALLCDHGLAQGADEQKLMRELKQFMRDSLGRSLRHSLDATCKKT